MLSTFLAVLRRDLLLAWRGRADVLVTLAFFVIVVCLFPFGVGAEPNLLRAIAPGVLWVAALLACLLSLHRLFAQDYSDGTLEQLLLSSEPAALWVTAKVLAFWLSTGLPVVVELANSSRTPFFERMPSDPRCQPAASRSALAAAGSCRCTGRSAL